MVVGLVVPVLSNFRGCTDLIASVDMSIRPIIIDNYNDNLGVAKAWNIGIERCMDLDVVIVANDDVKFYPGTMQKLVDYVQETDLVSVVATDTEQTGLHTDHFPDFCCYAIKPKDFVEKFGTFDENFKPAYFEDNDMSYRIKVGGGTQGLVLEARVDHIGSVTQFKGNLTKDDRVVSHEQFRANRDYYIAKWGGPPKEEKYVQPFNGIMGKTFKEWV